MIRGRSGIPLSGEALTGASLAPLSGRSAQASRTRSVACDQRYGAALVLNPCGNFIRALRGISRTAVAAQAARATAGGVDSDPIIAAAAAAVSAPSAAQTALHPCNEFGYGFGDLEPFSPFRRRHIIPQIRDDIRELLLRLLVQSDLAERLRTTQRKVSYWESGKVEPDLENLWRIADLFDITTDELIGRRD